METQARFRLLVQIIFLAAIAIGLYLTKELITTILFSFFLAYLLDPVYIRVLRLTRNRQASSFLALMVLFGGFLLVVLILVNVFTSEALRLAASEQPLSFQISDLSRDLAVQADRYLPASAAAYVGSLPLTAYAWIIDVILERLSAFALNLPDISARLIVAIFVSYYLLVDGRRLIFRALQIVPEKTAARRFLKELNAIYSTLFKVYFLTSMISGVLAAIGFFILEVPYPTLWGALTAMLTFLPFIGPSAVFLPLAGYYLLNQDYTRAGALVLFGVAFLMIVPENIILPRMAMRGAKIHPVVTILAYTAPVFVIGAPGIIVGPAIYGFVLAGYRTIIYLQEL